MVDRSSIVTFAPHVILQLIDGDALLLNLHDETVFALNETGARIAQLIGERHDVEAIVDRLSVEYKKERSDIAGDVETLVKALIGRGLLVVTGPVR